MRDVGNMCMTIALNNVSKVCPKSANQIKLTREAADILPTERDAVCVTLSI